MKPSSSRYGFGAELARNGDSVFMSAQDLRLPREAVVKVLSRTDDPTLVDRFVREARILARLQHPAILPVYELGVGPDGRPYVASRRASGRTLTEFLAVGDGREAGRYRMILVFERICQAIAYAHGQGVSHGGLATDSVWVDPRGEIQIGDWSRVVDAIDPIEDVRALGRILERILGDGPRPEDLDALSARCRGATAGAKDVDAKTAAAVVGAHLAAADDRARRLELEALASREATERARAGAEEARATSRAQRRRRRQSVALAAALVLAVLSGVLGWRWLEEGRRAHDARAREAVEAALHEAERHGRADGLADAVAAAERAAHLAHVELPDDALAARAEALANELSTALREEQEAAERSRRAKEASWRADEARIRLALEPFVGVPPSRGDVARAAWERPADLWAHLEAARHFLRAEPANAVGALRHLTAAVALRPASPALLERLADGLDAAGDAAEAQAARRRSRALASTSAPPSPAPPSRAQTPPR